MCFMKQKLKNYDYLIGEKNGMLTCKSYYRNDKNMPRIICVCDCGNEKELDVSNFVNRKNKISCGCNKGKKGCQHNYKHPLYVIWMSMRMRCYNKNEKSYKDYGGRGVVICEEWLNSFQSFFDWAISNGWKKGLFIDKDIKSDSKIYSPETCSIVTRAENNRKKRRVKLNWDAVNDILSSTETVKHLAKKYNCTISTIYHVKYKKTWTK